MSLRGPIPAPMDGRDPSHLRGDAITGDRYFSPEFAQAEWDHMWTRIWHIAGRTAEIPEPGDFLVHTFMKESVIVVRQEDRRVRAFYNSCGHGRTVQPMRPSLTDRPAEVTEHVFAHILRQWGIDPAAYATYEDFALQGWQDLKAAKRKLWR